MPTYLANLATMNADRRHQRMVFITGVSLGLVVGGAIVFFSQNTQIIKYPIEVSQNTVDKIVSRVLGSIKSNPEVNAEKEKKKYKTDIKTPVNDNIDSLMVVNLADSVETAVDTFSYNESQLTYTNNLNEEIQVKKDELIEVKSVEVLNVDFKNSSNTKDSLLQAISGVQLDKKNKRKFLLQVEYWKSPLNYRGYKLFKNKLVLFGLEPADEIILVYSGDTYYLKCVLGIFKLSVADDFRAYERVNNPAIYSLFEL